MHTTELIQKAEATGQPLATIARALGLNSNALSASRNQGRVSPGLAAALADYLGENVTLWTLTAIAEGERSAPLRRKLSALAKSLNS